MNKYKAAFAVFFLLVFTFNVIIYYTVFEFDECQAKAEMGQTISRMNSLLGTECFTLPLNRLPDTEKSEIWMNGKLYDIVKTEVKENSVIVYLLNDGKEEALVAKLGSQTEACCDAALNAGKTKHSSRQSIKTSMQKYFPSALVTFRYNSQDSIISCVINCFYLTPVPSILAPPPEPLS